MLASDSACQLEWLPKNRRLSMPSGKPTLTYADTCKTGTGNRGQQDIAASQLAQRIMQ